MRQTNPGNTKSPDWKKRKAFSRGRILGLGCQHSGLKADSLLTKKAKEWGRGSDDKG